MVGLSTIGHLSRRKFAAIVFTLLFTLALVRKYSSTSLNDASTSSIHLLGGPASPGNSAGAPKRDDEETRDRPSIKPIAYIFPQFHTFPENDRLWGANFTDWNSVRNVTVNKYGQQTLRPHHSVGYYNLLDQEPRRQQRVWLREMGFYGVVFHHYWFGRPVMDGVLQAMFDDGEPDIPFMLSWANEPWIARWATGGAANVFALSRPGAILIAQHYGGPREWRQHFDWLLPFLTHPRYIRVAGRAQLVVYDPRSLGPVGPAMFAAWRRWAVETAGLAGLDIIETLIETDDLVDRDRDRLRSPPDAVAEYSPRSGGRLDSAAWATLPRAGRVHHRSVSVCWDNTPRMSGDAAATVNPFCHPTLWQRAVLRVLHRVRRDPNPPGEENFVFVNALNEWAEGNVLEKSAQYDDRYGIAFRRALRLADREPWRDDSVDQATLLHGGILGEDEQADPYHQRTNDSAIANILDLPRVDVCVLISVPVGQSSPPPDANKYDLSHILRSLRAQRNPHWRAVVYQTKLADEEAAPPSLGPHLMASLDPRMTEAELPDELQMRMLANSRTAFGTDWVLENLPTISPGCARATRLLFSRVGLAYGSQALDAALPSHKASAADMIGLSFVSHETMMSLDSEQGMIPWERRCERFHDGTAQICQPCTLGNAVLDVSAILFRRAKFLAAGIRFETDGDAPMTRLAQERGWSWEGVTERQVPDAGFYDGEQADRGGGGSGADCAVIFGDTYPACRDMATWWLDSPDPAAAGCYSLTPLTSRFSWNVSIWDMRRFAVDPFCLRHSPEVYEELMGKR